MSEKTNNGINVKQNLGKDLTDGNSEIAASLFNRFVANEDDQFECYGIFYLNKCSDNETLVKNTIPEMVNNYSESCQCTVFFGIMPFIGRKKGIQKTGRGTVTPPVLRVLNHFNQF